MKRGFNFYVYNLQILGHNQCDQMARLFVQYLAIYSNEKLEQKQKYFPKKDLNKFLIHPQNIAKETFKVCQSGKFRQI